jgi:glycosyltransferase involved in cell wall biosynthesis
MNVVIVMPLAARIGGAERALWNQLLYGRDNGISWHVIFLEDGPMVAEVRGLDISADVVPIGRMREPHKLVSAVLKLARLFKLKQADAVLSWMTKAHLYAGPAARIAGVPAIWFQHGLSNHYMDRIATRIPSRGIFVAADHIKLKQARLKPVRPMHVVPGGVDLSRFDPQQLPSPEEARVRLHLPSSGPLIGIVGRLQRWKGMHTLIQAMPRVLEDYPEAHAVIVGGEHNLEPDYPGVLTRQIQELGLTDHVVMAGAQDNVPEWMQAMDIVVHASDCEPFGVVVVEGMALGKPVIAGDEGGPAEVITPGVNGLLTRYNDAAALATAILRFLDDPEFARNVGEAARLRAPDFSTRNFARNVIEGIVKCIGDTHPVAGTHS